MWDDMSKQRLLDEWIEGLLLLEGGFERQEHALVDLLNQTVKSNKGPIVVKAEGIEIPDISGAKKVEGHAPYGGEPYTDVIFWQGSDRSEKPNASSMNISCKIEGGAPSVINLSKRGLQQCYPGWYEKINDAARDKFIELGATPGHWSTSGGSIQKTTAAGKTPPTNLYNALKQINPKSKGKVSIHTLDGREYKLDAGENPPIAAGFGPTPKSIDPDGRVHYYNTSEVKVPDLFGIIPEEIIRIMFVGNVKMGGPVKYIYEGPDDPSAGSKFANGVLTIPGRFKTAESLIKVATTTEETTGPKQVVLRIRSGRFDAAVTKSGEALGKGPITSAIGKGRGIRFVSTMRPAGSKGVMFDVPIYGVDIAPPPGWDPAKACEYKPPKVEESSIRSLIRESLLLEELTSADKKEIEKISRKQAQKEIKKIVGNDLSKTIQEEIKKALKNKATKQEVANITKAVIKKLYRELAVTQQPIIDRIKI